MKKVLKLTIISKLFYFGHHSRCDAVYSDNLVNLNDFYENGIIYSDLIHKV
ncbi:hypothetical protein FD14_GL001743 [Secundilactobacillus similis DSM 23365 = JCM 2765]|uniref:Uncharacterized protein n=1 Tax=Secundilactobacillus similis DSM 23365 = JCM 2765 TaxID=1423804 RepID=A0A0R2EU16_9LACO|nr:hypothetical protein FD14_GL001743 [Secundilactobacillus similis DSM 23365 = JCM 2765]